MNIRPVVFLDMDDVLCISKEHNSLQMLTCFRENRMDCPEFWAGLVDAGAAANLRSLHEEFAPFYVISSTWPMYLDRSQMCDVFARTQLNFVRENLHDTWVTPRALSSCRYEEIDAWLNEFRVDTQPFLVLDDTGSGWSLAHSPLAHDGHVVLCKPGAGFTVDKLEQAREQLRRQMSAS